MSFRYFRNIGLNTAPALSYTDSIAFYGATNSAIASNLISLTFSVTTGGTNRFMCVPVLTNKTIVSVTYNGFALTLINSIVAGSGRTLYHYYIVAPSTGANNVVITIDSSVSSLIIGGATVYTGVNQTTPINASNTNDLTTETTTTTSVTSTVDNCWAIMTARGDGDGITAAGASTTQRANTNGYIQQYDSNGAITPAGARSLQSTQISQPSAQLISAITPLYA